jgi:acetoin utilization deacetylase AcuC-like enzyme
MAGTALVYTPIYLGHDTGSHPENAQRLIAILAHLDREGLLEGRRIFEPEAVPFEALAAVHDPALIEQILEAAEAGGRWLDADTYVSPGSYEAAAYAAGGALLAVDAVLHDDPRRVFVLSRPPGHHATRERAMGFCLFNGIAAAAQYALDRHGLERVAIVDWDVHHGNGTQECFWTRPDVVTISLHMRHGSWGQHHPQTGAPDELGAGDGTGRNVNIELPVGTGDEGYRRAWARVVEPLLHDFDPGLLVIACGQDASQYDPNGRMCVSMAGFRDLGAAARRLADAHCDGRLVLVQEGGYGRTYSAFCMHATLEGVLGTGPLLDDPLAYLPDDRDRGDAAIDAVLAAVGPHWSGIAA